MSDTNTLRSHRADRAPRFRGHDQPPERVLRRGGEGQLQHVLRGLSGLHHRLSGVHVLGDALREGAAENLQVRGVAERARLQSEGPAGHRSDISRPARHRDLDSRSADAHLTATVQFDRGVFYVSKAKRTRALRCGFCCVWMASGDRGLMQEGVRLPPNHATI